MKPKKKKKRELRQAFARFLQFITPRRNPGNLCTVPFRSIAILAQEKLGDSVLLTPLLKTLRAKFPELEIHIVTFSKASYNFFRTDSTITTVHYAKSNPVQYYRAVLSREFDLLFNTKDHPSTHFLLQTVLIRATYKVGHASEFHRGLYNHLIDMEFHSHIAMKNCALLSVLGFPATLEECRPTVPPMPISLAMKEFLQTINKGNAIGINLSAGEQNRKWPEDKWKKLIEMHPNEKFLVLCSKEEHAEKKRIENQFIQVIPSPFTQNLYEASVLIATLKLLVTPDTSLIHIASSTKTPVVGLYCEAPQDISRFGPLLIPYELVLSRTGEVRDIDTTTVAKAINKLTTSHHSTSWESNV